MVTDVCPQCSAATAGTGDHFDLNALSFAQLAPDLAGEIDINYRLVACTPPSDLSVQVDGNDGVGLWLRLVITVSAVLLFAFSLLPSPFWLLPFGFALGCSSGCAC